MSNRQQLHVTTASHDDNENKGNDTYTNLGLDGKLHWPIRIFTPLLFIAVLLVNYFMGINRNKEVSDVFNLWVTPPGFFFAIWGFIYAGIFIANIYNLIKNVWNLKTHIFFAVTNILNIIWTIVFDIGTKTSVCIAAYILIVLTVFIFQTWKEMGNIPTENWNLFTYINRNVFAFYLGWCIAASNINFGMNIVYWWGASKETQMIVFWIMAPLCALGTFGYICLTEGKNGVLTSFCVWLSVIWAFVGAAISSNKCVTGGC